MQILEERFGLILNKNVRLKLFGIPVEYTGKLQIDSLLLPDAKGDEVPLHIGKIPFDYRDIEYCHKLEDQVV